MRWWPIGAAMLAVAGCGRLAGGPAGPPDISGRWMPVAELAQAWPDPLPLGEEASAHMAVFDPDREDPTGFCMPYGTPRNTLATTSAMEVLQKGDRVYFIFQPDLLNAETRRVYLDGRAVPVGDDVVPTWLGTSRGRWDGASLAVETTLIEPQAIVSATGLPHSAKLTVSERWSLAQDPVRGRLLVDEITLEDPLYTAPIRTRRVFAYAPQAQMTEGQCSQRLWIDNLWRSRLGEHAAAKGRR